MVEFHFTGVRFFGELHYEDRQKEIMQCICAIQRCMACSVYAEEDLQLNSNGPLG